MNNPFDKDIVYTDDEIHEMLQRELEQYEAKIGKITPYERRGLRGWVASGNSVNDNPYDLYSEDGSPMDFITAKRVFPSLADDILISADGNAGYGAEYSSRRQRRAAVKRVYSCLSAIRGAEQKYLDRVPDNFQSTESYEVGELAVETIDEILDLLTQVY